MTFIFGTPCACCQLHTGTVSKHVVVSRIITHFLDWTVTQPDSAATACFCFNVCVSVGLGAQVSLGRSQLDVEAIVTKQRILLKSIPRGMAKVLFTARDFGNFLAHPFMKQAASKAVQVLPALMVVLPLKIHCSCTESMHLLLAATAEYVPTLSCYC